ncbi:MAG: hypothetical protein AAB964_00425 [Patescibacteria group bacterium]
MGLALGIIVLILAIAAGAYGYFVYLAPLTQAPENTLVTDQQAPQDGLSQIESDINAESNTTFDAEMDSLESSF